LVPEQLDQDERDAVIEAITLWEIVGDRWEIGTWEIGT
jgi:hypothetical protein